MAATKPAVAEVNLMDVGQPVLDTDLPSEELKETFESLFDQAYDLFRTNDEDSIEQASIAMCQRIQVEITNHPILAKTVSKEMLMWSLLTVVCEKTNDTPFGHDAIKCLIRANPIALLWRWGDRYEPSTPIKTIAENHSVLLPWIAQEFQWIFQHKRCRKDPPHLHLVQKYSNTPDFDASVVRQFYEAFPQGLEQKMRYGPHQGFALQLALGGWEECDAELFIWMACKYPEAMQFRTHWGTTILHTVCMHLAQKDDDEVAAPLQCTENMMRIFRFIVEKCPRLVSKKGRGGRGLPLHDLAKCCNRPLVQEAIVLLLKQIPDGVNTRAKSYLPNLKTVPFIQQIHSLVVLESALNNDEEWVIKASRSFISYSASSSATSSTVATILASWANDYKERSLAAVASEIEETCNAFQGPDIADESDEEENDFDEDLYEEEAEENEDFSDSSEEICDDSEDEFTDSDIEKENDLPNLGVDEDEEMACFLGSLAIADANEFFGE